ncbi:MAG: Asp-tRNA(Asn)/Glu-tRNA(Gln) amidotransferase GatCAB subunit B [Pelagibacterales bacterium]|nr:Asp-tRNA(Asn)/Glu-tRNA(Gln) amidotransferase GatCAB subunit B [Pelagibacterales bacterium]PPR15344.1 MAG: Aspartyl/glutamyl-tRNA(Asn/Gln) amidotransferase subunit B [Alphaproteobacteria bacterium MarineAlpha9_Bin3]|tara:strand:- start:1405 stop:2865 length:1461 start_codon:yes stop_codon:yes gene_type:complete
MREAIKLKGETGIWEMVIGLEIHAQVNCKSKLFSGSATDFGASPNSQVSYVDAAMPGMLPVINSEAVNQAIKTGHALNAKINNISIFDRKNYFYPDLPQGYQISQFKSPIVGEGWINIDLGKGEIKKIGIERLHLEQDAGKLMHDQHPRLSFVDLNRSGIPLMEIVSKPDMRDWEEAGAYLRKLRSIVRYIGSCDGNMDQGSLRCDANISVRRPGEEFGTRCELKNINSVKFMMKAVEFEAYRQIEIIENGGEVKQETRLYDPNKNETRSMRSKEEAHDYRYFPDPDLLPLNISNDRIEKYKDELPELPDQKRERFQKDYGLSFYDADVLTADKSYADFFEIVSKGRDAKFVANWVITNFFAMLNEVEKSIEESPVNAQQLGELFDLIQDGTISGRTAKDVFEEMFTNGGRANDIVEAKGLKQISNTDELESMAKKIIEDNSEQVSKYKNGNEKLFGWFVGQMMKNTGGTANPKVVNEILKTLLNK